VPPLEKVSGLKIGIITALKLLQERLNETQPGMAQRLGCSLRAYTAWLAGDRVPTGEWMLKILSLCPDEETRKNFLDIAKGGSTIRSTPTVEMPIEKKEAPRKSGIGAGGKRTSPHWKFPPE